MKDDVKKTEKPELRDERGRWLQGTSSPSPGRPVSSRQRIAESLLKDIGSLWDRRGPEILERLADEEPAKIAAIAYGILPKEAFVKIENQLDPRLKTLQNMDAEALAALASGLSHLSIGQRL